MKSLTSEEAQAHSNEIAISYKETVRLLDWYNPKRKELDRVEKSLLKQADNLITASLEELTIAEAHDEGLVEPWLVSMVVDQNVLVRNLVFGKDNDKPLHEVIIAAGMLLGTDMEKIKGLVFELLSGSSLKHEDVNHCVVQLHDCINYLLAVRVGRTEQSEMMFCDQRIGREYLRLKNVIRRQHSDLKPALDETIRNWDAAIMIARSDTPLTHQEAMTTLKQGRVL